MDTSTATRAFGALAHPRRLETFRLLVTTGPEGLPAGAIARALEVPHNTMSTHLSILAHAGLVRSQRDGRSVIYAIDFDGLRGLLSFLMEDCCGGRPEICVPALETLMVCCVGADPGRAPGHARS